MSTTTSKLKLTKPSSHDIYDIAIQNNNMDIIDNTISNIGMIQTGSGTKASLSSTSTMSAISDSIILKDGVYIFIGNVRFHALNGKSAAAEIYYKNSNVSDWTALTVTRVSGHADAAQTLQTVGILNPNGVQTEYKIYGFQSSGSAMTDINYYWRVVRII